MAVTPIPPLNSAIALGGTSQTVFAANPNGGVITNPSDPADQGVDPPEVLYVNPVGPAATSANGTTFALYPGQSWTVIPEQSTTTQVNALTTGHKYSAVSW